MWTAWMMIKVVIFLFFMYKIYSLRVLHEGLRGRRNVSNSDMTKIEIINTLKSHGKHIAKLQKKVKELSEKTKLERRVEDLEEKLEDLD